MSSLFASIAWLSSVRSAAIFCWSASVSPPSRRYTITIGACSPPCSSSAMPSTLVDSASAGRNVVDSLFSASLYLPGRLAAPEATSATRASASTTHFAVRPAGNVRKRDNAELLREEGGGFYRRTAREAMGDDRTPSGG